MSHQSIEPIHFLDQLDPSDLIKLKAIVFDTPEAEKIKIQMIKDELSTGRYQINSQYIADKLMEFSPIVEEVEMV